MSDADHTRWKDDIAAYLLGALEPGESAELERHLAGCHECQADLHRLRPAVDLLPESVERLEPPARLRAEVLGQARAEAKSSATAPRGRRAFGWRPLAGLAAVALIAAAVGGYALRDSDTGGGTSTTITAGKLPDVTAELTREGDSGTLRLANVSELANDRVLEAWVQREGEVTPVRGLFAPDSSGRATATIPDMRGVEAVMVTAEPEGGSKSPTGTPMVTIAMPE